MRCQVEDRVCRRIACRAVLGSTAKRKKTSGASSKAGPTSNSALTTASAIGDDTLQRQADRGRVVAGIRSPTALGPNSRKRWFMTGYQQGTVGRPCDTFGRGFVCSRPASFRGARCKPRTRNLDIELMRFSGSGPLRGLSGMIGEGRRSVFPSDESKSSCRSTSRLLAIPRHPRARLRMTIPARTFVGAAHRGRSQACGHAEIVVRRCLRAIRVIHQKMDRRS